MERLLHEKLPRDVRLWGSARAGLLFAMHLGAVTNYCARTCLSVAIDGNRGISAEMGWSDTQKGIVLSAFFYSYTFSQFPAGFVGIKFGPRRVLQFAYAAQAVLCAVFPSAVRCDTRTFVSLAALHVQLSCTTNCRCDPAHSQQ